MDDQMMPGQRRALMIGINQYPGMESRYQLLGCVNDARLMADLLHHVFEFPEEQTVLLLDQAATRAGIRSALEDLVRSTQPGDMVVLFYAGHGSYTHIQDPEKAGGLAQTIVPHDSGRYPSVTYENRDIVDTEIHAWLLHLADRTSFITLIMDCCHSATLHRAGRAARGVGPQRADLSPVAPPPSRLALNPAAGPLGRGIHAAATLALSNRYLYLSAARDDETASEHVSADGGSFVYHGALTYFLAQQLGQARPGATYRDVFEALCLEMGRRYAQHPQMEGALDRELFGVRDIAPMRYVRITGRTEDGVSLQGGSAYGLKAGSIWAVYEPAQKTAGAAPPIGQIQIEQAGVLEASARILSEERPIPAGARAVEVERVDELRLRVAVLSPSDRQEMRQETEDRLRQSPWLSLAADRTEAHACVLEENGRWVIVDGSGAPLLRSLPVGHKDELLQGLEALARFDQTLGLHNPYSALLGLVQFHLLKQTPRGWERAVPATGGLVMYREGETLAMEVQHACPMPLHLAILGFSTDRAIQLLYPVARGAADTWPPGQLLRIVSGQLFIPREAGPEADHGQPCVDQVKLFASTRPVDFSTLVQEGIRGSAQDRLAKGAALSQLLVRSLAGYGERRVKLERSADDDDWTSETRLYRITPARDDTPGDSWSGS